SSISRTRWPFPSPPMADYKAMDPRVTNWGVSKPLGRPSPPEQPQAPNRAGHRPTTPPSSRQAIDPPNARGCARAPGGVKNIEVVELFHVKHWKQRFSGL